MLFQLLRALVFGLVAVMLLPAVGLAAIGAPSLEAGPAALAGWLVLGAVGAYVAWVFVTDAIRTRRRALAGIVGE